MSLPSNMAPFDIPEILILIGQFLPLWGWDELGNIKFLPHSLLPCLSVSRQFRNTLLPVMWYTLDERAMSAIPAKILQRYASHFRIVHGLDKKEEGVSAKDDGYVAGSTYFSPLSTCTRLVEFTKTGFFDRNHGAITDLVKRNPQLQRVTWTYCSPVEVSSSTKDIYSYTKKKIDSNDTADKQTEIKKITTQKKAAKLTTSKKRASKKVAKGEERKADPFKNLQGLRHADIGVYDGNVLQLLQPSARTLSSLRLQRGTDVLSEKHALVLPNLKELHVWSCDETALPRACPELEYLRIDSIHSKEALAEMFASRGCPKLTRFSTSSYGGSSHDEDLGSVLNAHPGLEQLELRIGASLIKIGESVKHHGRSLKSLKLHWDCGTKSGQPECVINILQSCAQLASLELDDLSRTSIDWLLTNENWKNPQALENLVLRGARMSINGISIRRPKQPFSTGVTSETLAAMPQFGWKVHGGLLEQNLAFLKELFERANERFSRLRVISLNGVVYRKVIA